LDGRSACDCSPQFNALNLMTVLSVEEESSSFHGIFVDPLDTGKIGMPGDDRICVWDSEIGRSSVLHRAVSP